MKRFFWMVPCLFAAATAWAEGLSFDRALQLAEAQAPVLEVSRARLDAARFSRQPADALPDPELMLGFDNVPVQGSEAWALDAEPMTMQTIGVRQRIPGGAKRDAMAQVAEAASSLAGFEQTIQQLAIRRSTAGAWIQRYYLERQLHTLRSLSAEYGLLQDSLAAQVQSGTAQTETQLQSQLAMLDVVDRGDALRQRLRTVQATLQQWLGDAAFEPLQGEPPTFAIDPQRLRRHLHHHPELKIFDARLAMADAQLQAAVADKRPDWSVELAYGRREDFADMVSFNVSVGLPLFTGSRQGPRIDARRQDLRAVGAEREVVAREHRAMLETQLAAWESADAQLTRLQTQRMPLAEQRVQVLEQAYRAGRADLSMLVDARIDQRELALDALMLAARRAELAASLHYTFDEELLP